jgi:histone demethylase JARID1
MNSTSINLKSVPELRPSESEFVHPIKYLSRPDIVELGVKYGILKVIPPLGWKPEFALDWDTFKFHTRIQKLHELNLRNRSRACFLEGFNCFLQSKGIEPLPVIENLCYGVSNEYPLSKTDLNEHLNGWFELKNSSKVHIHDIFVSKETRKWFYKIKDKDNDLLKKLSSYCKILSEMLNLNDDYNQFKEGVETDKSIIPTENSNTTLQRLLKSPAALLVQPENIQQLQRMKTRILKSYKKTKRFKSSTFNEPVVIDLLTPPSENSNIFYDLDSLKDVDTVYPLSPEILTPEELDETCVVCHSSKSPETTLICDGCSRGFHMKCLSVPLEKIPKYDWFCNECLIGSTSMYAEYGFEEEFEKQFSLNEFKKYCAEWENQLFQLIRSGSLGKKFDLSEEELKNNKFSEENISKIFWNLTNGNISIPEDLKRMKIRYGADINSTKPGEISGFPTVDNPRIKEEDFKYFNSEWNLTKLPFARGSLLRYICNSLGDEITRKDNDIKKEEQISGMSVPWMYIGGPLSTFCWHKEDHYTLSANYSHLGAPKKWYSIPASFSEKFEELINNIAPEYEAKQKDLMHQLVSMVSPDEINGIPVYETIQRPGEFIITFPKVYHSGFNYGFNVNEAVNFTLPLWIPYSISAVQEYEKVGKECVFETFKLLRKIFTDLNKLENREEWIKDTGIDEKDIDILLAWVTREYNSEIEKFNTIYKDDGFSKLMNKMNKIKISNYLKECENIVKKSKGLQGVGVLEMEGGEGSENIEIEDKVCMDCKTRVHFHWVLIDFYKDCMYQLDNDVTMEEEKSEGLGIIYKDKESEWNAIIKKAKNKETETKSTNGLRRSSRRVPKRKFIQLDEDDGQDDKGSNNKFEGEDEKKKKRELRRSLELLREENGFFGQNVMCINCFQKEIHNLNNEEQVRILKVSRVVEEEI